MSDMLEWAARLCGWRASVGRVSVSGVGGVLACVAWAAC